MNNLSSDSGGKKKVITKSEVESIVNSVLHPRPIITPKEFKSKIAIVLQKFTKEFVNAWYSAEPGKETTNILDREKGVYEQTARALGLSYQSEYWHIDAGFYKQEEKLINLKGKAFGKALCVAIEHENETEKSYQEMNKLATMQAPLKVLITYPAQGDDGRSAWPSDDVLLNNYKKQIINADFFGLAKENKSRTMVIFGYYKKNKTMLWEYHLFNGETSKWEEI